jgi:predicted ATPase
LTPFVGREDELRLFINRWERAVDGEGQVITVIGEAGIGKSRLVHEFRKRIANEGHTWLEATTAALFQNTPFYAVAEMLRQGFHWQVDHDNERRLAALEASLVASGVNGDSAMALIAGLLDLPLGGKYPPLTMPPEQQRKRLLGTLVAWATGAARVQPMVIATEDLHWADPSTLEVIQLLVEQGATSPLMLIYTARPEFRPQWPSRAHHTQITLARLTAQHVRAIIREVAARKALSDETKATLVERTGGVPLFVEELTQAVLEGGGANNSGRDIPATLYDSLMARLDRLGPAKEVAQVGAVIGREFSYELLQAVHQIPEAKLQEGLVQLADAELLYVRGIAPDATYQFKHALIQEAAYEALLKSRRKELHSIVARMIEERFLTLRETHPEVLARHWTEAGELDFAINAWQKAGEQASSRSSHAEAISNLNVGINLAGSLPAGLDAIRRELPLQLRLLPAIIATTGWGSSEVAETAARARELCRLLGDPPELFSAMYAMWSVSFIRAELLTARTMAQQLLQRAEASDDAALLQSAFHTMALTEYHLGNAVFAREHLRNAIAQHRPQYSLNPFAVDTRVSDLSYQGWTLWDLGYPDQALRSADEAVAAAEGLNPHSVVFAVSYRSELYQHKNDLDALEASAQQQLRITSEYGLVDFGASAAGQLGVVAVRRGSEEAIARIKEWVDSFRRTGVKVVRPRLLCELAAACIQFRHFDQAFEALREAATIAAESEDRFCEPETWRLQGELSLTKDPSSIEGARRCFERAIAIARAQSGKFWELRATNSLARLLRDTGRREAARTMLAEIYNWFTEGFDTPDLKEAKALLDELSS